MPSTSVNCCNKQLAFQTRSSPILRCRWFGYLYVISDSPVAINYWYSARDSLLPITSWANMFALLTLYFIWKCRYFDNHFFHDNLCWCLFSGIVFCAQFFTKHFLFIWIDINFENKLKPIIEICLQNSLLSSHLMYYSKCK